jgi:hypothetical protein
MTENYGRVFIGLFFMVIAFGGVLFMRGFLTRRAIFKVIEIFYRHQALGIRSAKTLHELGLERPDILRRMTKPRDYKQHALQILIKRDIIHVNEDGRMYMVEERLDENLRSKRKDLFPQG